MVRTESTNSYQPDAYAKFVRPLLFKLDPEEAHDLVFRMAPVLQALSGELERLFHFEDSVLATELLGHRLANPVGLAAGFDKNAKLGSLLDALGLGFAEIGSVTDKATIGNPKPRVFRLPKDEAVVNRLGLNGDGAAVVAMRMSELKIRTPMSINIAKTNDPVIVGELAVSDLVNSFRAVRDLSVPYITVNASCPNTHDGIIREMGELEDAVSQMQENNSNQVPLLLKLSPDSTDSLLLNILEVGRKCKVAGYVCVNTSTSRDGLATPPRRLEAVGKGGLSGKPLKEISVAMCRRVMKMKEANQIVVACGGIASGADVYEFLKMGVPAIQLYTALIYRGPGLIRQIKSELAALLKRDGTNVIDVVMSARSQAIGL